jgi:hypothetical protein
MNFEFKNRFKAPTRTKRLLRWCRKNNAKTAFFLVFSWPYVFALWGALIGFFVAPKEGWSQWFCVSAALFNVGVFSTLRFTVVYNKLRWFFT